MSDPPDIYSVNKRKSLTPKQKMEMFIRAKGICCICQTKINGVHETWDEHWISLADGGGNEIENRLPAHDVCARKKTAQEAKDRSRGRKFAERHFGAKRPRSRLSKPKGMTYDWQQRRYVRDDEGS